ncbi:MAG: hypothetical protein Q9195_007515 [Heterodermia aff. obscurata]
MSIPRLNFLYPHLFHSIKTSEPIVSRRSLRFHQKQGCSAGFSSTAKSKQETYPQRYGPANEPIPPSQLPTSPPENSADKKAPESLSTAIEKEVKAAPPQKQDAKQNPPTSKASDKTVKETSPEVSAMDTGVVAPKSQERPTELDAAESHPKERHVPPKKGIAEVKPLERVLQMDLPGEEHKPPHLHAPPYVHHFDTFTLVRDLEKEGFTQAQSVTLMKAVRSLLALNLDVARESLVSKSDVENETYLFRAACSELRTEILALRRNSAVTRTTQRSHLQHEVDILSQRASQDSLALKDDLRGLLNDRKMSVSMQHQVRESAIQELNYKITVALNSGSKSEVEGLRWLITRRAVLAIVCMAGMVIGALRVASWRKEAREVELAKVKAETEKQKEGSSGGGGGGGGSHTVPSREMGTQTEEVMMRSVEEGSGPSYVSLG